MKYVGIIIFLVMVICILIPFVSVSPLVDIINTKREKKKMKKKNKKLNELREREELKPCPFCGGEARCHNLSTNDDPAHYTIICTECWASIPAGDSEEETTNRWNRRK